MTQVAATAPGVVALHSSGTNAFTCRNKQLQAVMLEAYIPSCLVDIKQSSSQGRNIFVRLFVKISCVV